MSTARASPIGFPCSVAISRSISTWLLRTTSSSFARCFRRCPSVVDDQWRNAFPAAATAASISARPARSTSAKGSPDEGRIAGTVRPVRTSCPSMIGAFGVVGRFLRSSPPA
jgi:hypothetical protein